MCISNENYAKIRLKIGVNYSSSFLMMSKMSNTDAHTRTLQFQTMLQMSVPPFFDCKSFCLIKNRKPNIVRLIALTIHYTSSFMLTSYHLNRTDCASTSSLALVRPHFFSFILLIVVWPPSSSLTLFVPEFVSVGIRVCGLVSLSLFIN